MTVLAMVSRGCRAAFERKAAVYGLDVVCIESTSELTALAHAGKQFSVAILPATLPDGGVWALWGQVRLLNPRPEILVYAPNSDFQFWAGVLESGGHDVLVEPFSAAELHNAVLKAEQTFKNRLDAGAADDVS